MIKVNDTENKMKYIVTILFGIVPLLITAIIFPYLPSKIAIHFGITGNADSYGTKASIFLIPCIGIIAMLIKMYKINFYDSEIPKRSEFKKVIIIVAIFNFLTYIYLYMVLPKSLVFENSLIRSKIMNILLGIILIVLGNIKPKNKKNGIWGELFESSKYRFKFNRIQGYLCVIIGIIIVVTTLICSLKVRRVVDLGGIIAIVIFRAGYTFYYRNEKEVLK